MEFRRLLIPAFAWVLLFVSTLVAQNPEPKKAKSVRDRVADRLILRDGTQLWGYAVSEKPARLLIRTAWLMESNAEFYEQQLNPAIQQTMKEKGTNLADQLASVMNRLSDDDPEQRQRKSLLSEIHRRLLPKEDVQPDFLILEVAKPRLRSMDKQSEQRRELCRFAILNHVDDYEELEWKSVSQQLQAIPPQNRITQSPEKPNNAALDLPRILSAVDLQMNSATRLIQSGNQVIDESTEPDFSVLLSSMLGGNVQSLLNELLNEGQLPGGIATPTDALPAQAMQMAEAKGHSSIVLSGFEFDVEAGTAVVSRSLFRKLEDGKWTLLVAVRHSSSVADVQDGQVDALQQDPQLQQITGLAESLGLGGEQFSTALKLGAVVQNALASATQDFDRQVQSYVTTAGLSAGMESLTIPLE
jgi:hypothetical protein